MEPVFLQAEAGGLPQLKRVIVAAGEKIAMEPTLAESIAAVFGAEAPPTEPVVAPPAPVEPEEAPTEPVAEPPAPAEPEKPVSGDIASLIQQAQQHYDSAQRYLKEGDWAGYGRELDALKAVLDRLTELATD